MPARRETRAEKKHMAKAMRQKALGTLGMTTNEKDQVVTKTSLLKQMEEPGLTCCVCREGYRFQACSAAGGVGECCVAECQHQVQWTAFCLGASCPRISLRHMPGQPCEKWVESSRDVDGPHYYTVLAM
ncbi:E3 ubiquitin-protein ligase UBR4-like isoform 1-T3 [Salvelinus alpinus]